MRTAAATLAASTRAVSWSLSPMRAAITAVRGSSILADCYRG
jgi:hypothetical protein